jgi:hypothetical protein
MNLTLPLITRVGEMEGVGTIVEKIADFSRLLP